MQDIARLRQRLTSLEKQASGLANAPLPLTSEVADGLSAALQALEAVSARLAPTQQGAAWEREAFTRSVLDALAAHIAVLDAQGTIVAVNEAWRRFGREHYAPSFVWTGVGLNYLQVCQREATAGVPEAREAFTGLEAVLQGRQAQFTMEYPCHMPGHPRWFLLQATPLPPPHKGLVLAHTDITARKQAEEQLRGALHEKEVLLREVSHRVKNNLQVVSSLLSLQAGAIEDARLEALFKDSQDRIRSMALVHDLLHHTDTLAQINLAHYATRLIEELARSYAIDPERITLQTRLEDVWVGLDTATPCGLLLHELLSNCFKHAFPEGRSGNVRVELHTTAERSLVLRVGDTGCGFPDELDFRATDSLGLQLVCTLAEQLQGTIDLERASGSHFTITFPL
jgi:two-component sensor histidine kinase